MFKSTKLKTMLMLLAVVLFASSCTKEKDSVMGNDPNNSSTIENVNTKGEMVDIVKIQRGHKTGTWPHQHCTTPLNKACWLWFQSTQRDLINYPYATYEKLNDSTLKLNVDFSAISTMSEAAYWQNDITNGYLTIGDTIIISNNKFSNSIEKTGDIMILPGSYTVNTISSATNPYQYSINVKYN